MTRGPARPVTALGAAVVLVLSAAWPAGGAGAAAAAPARKAPASHGKRKAKRKEPPQEPRPVAIRGAAALAPFFEELAELARNRTGSAGGDSVSSAVPGATDPPVVRVLHFGDSHVAADYWSGELRRLFQERWGDAGPGFVMPGRPWRYFRHSLVRSLPAEGWETAGLGDLRDGIYGLSGTGLSPDPGSGPAALEGTFTRFEVQLAALADDACASVAVDGVTLFAGRLGDPSACGGAAGASCCSVRVERGEEGAPLLAWVSPAVPLSDGPHLLEVRDGCGGALRVLGTDLESGRPGVLWDTLGINGAEMVALEKWAPGLRARLLAHADPALIVVSYGTNELGRGDLVFDDFKASCVATLSGLRREAPRASVLVTGPADRSSRRKRARLLVDANERIVIRALREAAAETGCAFWDAKAAMGGDGSIARWRSRNLAQRDLVHLTGPGYVKLAHLLFGALAAEEKGAPAPR